ncbi:hypothetical protein Tco_0422464 [Tanacetum coccineum]
MSCKIISSAFSADGTGTGGVSRADCLDDNQKRITVDHFGTLDSAVSVAGLGDLGALGVLCVPWILIKNLEARLELSGKDSHIMTDDDLRKSWVWDRSDRMMKRIVNAFPH